MSRHPRRRILQLTGTGAAASIAGCQSLQSIGGNGSDSDGESGDGDGESTTATGQLAPDEDAAQDLQTRYSEGNLSQEEAQKEMQGLVEDAEADLADLDGVTVEESNLEFGYVRLSGGSDALLAALNEGHVGVLYPGDDYESLIEEQEMMQQQREQMQGGNATSGGE